MHGTLLLCLALLTVTAQTPGRAWGDPYGYHHGDDDNFGWAIVADGHTNMSEFRGKTSLDQLKDQFGERFLYFREGDREFVVRDRKFQDRAAQVTKPLATMGQAYGEAVVEYVRLSIGNKAATRAQAKLIRRQASLARQMARREMRDESTKDLEREVEALQREAVRLDGDRAETRSHKKDLERLARRRDEAGKRMHRASESLKREMREILDDAKAEGLAKRIN